MQPRPSPQEPRREPGPASEPQHPPPSPAAAEPVDGLGWLPERMAEGMAAIGEAVGEAASAQALVDERLAEVAEGHEALRRELMTLREEVRSQVATLRGEVKGMLDAVVTTVVEESGDRRELDTDLRRRLEELRATLEAWGTPKSSPKLAADLAALTERVSAITTNIQDEVAEAVSERMEYLLELRFEALVQLIESRLRTLAPPLPENGRKAGLFRRSAV